MDVKKPNIIYILADDLGYGDVSSFNEKCGFQTSGIDTLASEGMSFYDAHATSSVCTPSRYSILTGQYCWRSILKKDVLQGYDKPIIDVKTETVAAFLQRQGYHTACIGKWHLGIEWALTDERDKTSVEFSKPIKNGPVDRGFEYFYGISASLDMPPYVYIENSNVTAFPNRNMSNEWDCGNSYNKKMFRKGPVGSDFCHENVMEHLLQQALKKMNEWKESPFFLYLSLTAPHTPILPPKKFQGKSKTNEYGDFVLVCDDVVNRINNWIKEQKIEENTIVIFTSDNGCSPRADYPELAQYGHNPSYIFRGTKFDIFEGGHRVPLIVKWKDKIVPGSICKKMTSLADFFATVCDILEKDIPEGAAQDSISALPLWKGADNYKRKYMILHSVNGSFSIRNDDWKLILCPDSGGKSFPIPGEVPSHFPSHQLYCLKDDIRERHNRISEFPQIAEKLEKVFKKLVDVKYREVI